MDVGSIIDIVETGGLIGLLLVILLGGAKGWWVYGREHRDVKEDRDEWKNMALTGTQLADKAVQVAKTSRR